MLIQRHRIAKIDLLRSTIINVQVDELCQNADMASTIRINHYSCVYQWSCWCSSEIRNSSISLSLLSVGGRPYHRFTSYIVDSTQLPLRIAAGRSNAAV